MSMIRQQNINSVIPVENQMIMHKAMEKYNVDWWNSADLKQVARYQLYEKTLLLIGMYFVGGWIYY